MRKQTSLVLVVAIALSAITAGSASAQAGFYRDHRGYYHQQPRVIVSPAVVGVVALVTAIERSVPPQVYLVQYPSGQQQLCRFPFYEFGQLRYRQCQSYYGGPMVYDPNR